jgi:hypothetical protein
MLQAKHFLVFIITPAIPHGAFKMEVTFCVKAVYRPVLAKRVPVIGSTPGQWRDREQESPRTKEHCAVELRWSTPDECRGPEESFRSRQAALSAAEKQSVGCVDPDVRQGNKSASSSFRVGNGFHLRTTLVVPGLSQQSVV